VEDTGIPGENHQLVASHWQTLLYNVVLSTPHLGGIQSHNVSGDGHWLHIVINQTTIWSRPRQPLEENPNKKIFTDIKTLGLIYLCFIHKIQNECHLGDGSL
jgi:hypothetical protein